MGSFISKQIKKTPEPPKESKMNLQEKIEFKFHTLIMELLSVFEELDIKQIKSAMEKAVEKADKDITEYYAKKSEE